MTHIVWESVEEPGIEHLDLHLDPQGGRADGLQVRVLDGGPIRLRYAVAWDGLWRVRRVTLALDGFRQGSLELTSNGEGHWSDGAGADLAHLAGCLDVDILASPFTNTLPIRRLLFAPGKPQNIAVAYISVPDLRITRAPQRYTFLGSQNGRPVYRYENVETGYTADLPVDSKGVVWDYPEYFRRVWPQA